MAGHVTDANSNEPIEGANIVVRQKKHREGASTSEEGRFQVSVSPGSFRLEVSALGYKNVDRSVEVEAGETVQVAFELEPQPYSLNEVVVLEQGGDGAEPSSTVQRVEAQAIEQQDAADVSELAPLVPATHVQTNSRGQTILYLRNAGDRQVGQFFDGALLNIPWDNRVDISLIPASVVESITVTKGVPSVRYGANVLGGAINFQSRTLESQGRTTELQGALGTAEQRRTTITHLGRTDRWDYTAAVQYAERGNQPLSRNANLQHNQPHSERRVNTDRQLVSGFGRASHRLQNGGRVGVTVLHVDAEKGVAPEGNEANPGDTRYWRYPLWQKSTVIASGQVPMGPRTTLRGAAWGSRFAQDIADYENIEYDRLRRKEKGRDWTGGVRLIGTQNLPLGSLTLAVNGLTSRHEKTSIPSRSAESSSVYEYHQHIFSGGLEYEAQVHPRVEVTGGVNLDGTATPKTGPFPDRDPFYAWGLTSGIRVDLSENWALRGATGRKSRFPTMRELFGAALGKFVPNPNLNPVTAWIGEVGMEYRSSTWSLGVTPFLNRVYDTIDKRTFQQGPNQEKEQRVNLQGARIYGVETTGRWQPTEALVVDGNLTWSRPRSFTATGVQKLDEKPARLGTGRISYDFPFGVSLMGQARYTDGVYARNQQNEFVPLPSSLILDARVSSDLTLVSDRVRGTVYLRGDNLSDEARFIGLGLPAPGRSFRVGVKLTL